MAINARSVLTIFALLTFVTAPALLHADDWKGTLWDEMDSSDRCHPSLEAYMKFSEGDENIRANEMEDDAAHRYILIGDYTSMRNAAMTIYQKYKNGSICPILFMAPSASFLPKFSKDGVLEEVTTYNAVSGDEPITEVIYRKNSKGRFLPIMCTWQYHDGKYVSVSCPMALGLSSGKYIPPSFDCARTNLEVEKIICSSETLSNLDASLAKNYGRIKSLLADKDRQQLLADQRIWLKQRNTSQTAECLTESYTRRIGQICNDYPVTSGNPSACITTEEALAPQKEAAKE